MKLLSSLILAALLTVGLVPAQIQSFVAPGIYNKTVSIVSGTPAQISTSHIVISTLSIQMQHGASVGLGYVCIYKTTPASKCTGGGQLAFELAPATSTAPGSQLSYPVDPTIPFDLFNVWIDGDTTGSGAIVSYNVK